jgi:hypothetical protein
MNKSRNQEIVTLQSINLSFLTTIFNKNIDNVYFINRAALFFEHSEDWVRYSWSTVGQANNAQARFTATLSRNNFSKSVWVSKIGKELLHSNIIQLGNIL